MRATKFILAILTLALGSVPALALSPGGQKSGGKAAGPPPRAAAPAGNQGNPQAYTFHPKGPGPHRGEWLRRYGSLPPNQQEQQLQRDPTFRSLPPDKQNHLMDRLRKFDSQPPEKKQQILDRMETFEHMTPQQQTTARNLFQRYRALPDDQRTKVSQGYHRLRGMPPEAQQRLLNSDEFRNNYTDEQRALLRGMTDLNVGPTR